MAASKRDELTKRFADRLQQAPQRGSVATDHARSARPSSTGVAPLSRGAAGGRLRGHLVPYSLHADARRLKVALQTPRGTHLTWDQVAAEALELLLSADRDDVDMRLD